jgi:hypothetical protein
MPELKYGQLSSWDEGSVSTGQKDFMSLVEGDNTVRVITNPYQFVVHWVDDATGTKRKIRCAIEKCPLCKSGNKAQSRWYIGVIERKTGQAQILEISSQIYTAIKSYVSSPKWGDVRKYDINIKRGPKNTQPLYTVIVEPPEPLAEKDKLTKADFLERVDISKFIQPSTPEEIMEKLGSSPQPQSKFSGQQSQRQSQRPAPQAKPVVSDEDFNFGDDDDDI